jgi:hypothetical protein
VTEMSARTASVMHIARGSPGVAIPWSTPAAAD